MTSSGAPESRNPAPEPSSEDAWGDAVQLARDEAGGATVLPARRESKDRSSVTVTVIEGSLTGSEVGESLVSMGESVPVAKLKVREIIGNKIRQLRPKKPEIEKMPRKDVIHSEAVVERWEIEGKEWSETRSFSVKWAAGITVGMIALILISLALLPWINRINSNQSNQVDAEQMVEAELLARDVVMEALVVRQDEAMSMFRVFATAKVADDVLPLLRNPKADEALVRASGMKAIVPHGWIPSENSNWVIKTRKGKAYGVLSGILPNFQNYEAFFVLGENQLLLDWQATTAYSTASFLEMYKGTGDTSEIRGVLSPGVFYTMSFPEGEYQCYQLMSPNGMDVVWCYAKLNSDLAIEIGRLFIGGGIVQQEVQPAKVTLKLKRGSNESLGNQWLIEDLLHEDWIEL